MITIGKPYIERICDKTYVKVDYHDEIQNINEQIYFATSSEWGDYFTDQTSDPFVVGVLLPAITTNQDIIVDGAISEQLWYNLNRIILYLVSNVYNANKIQIIPKLGFSSNSFSGDAVGCGCSLGIDSLTAIFRHLENDCPNNFRLTHLTCFNVGAFGSKDLEVANESYKKDLVLIKSFAEEVNLPLVCIESNIAITHNNRFSFDECGVLRNMATALSMQKLFGKYYYGSSCSVKDSYITRSDMGYYADIVIPRLSTESTQLYVSESDMTRVEKTAYLSDNSFAQKHLYVCWKEIFKNEYPHYYKDIKESAESNRNCTLCDKCLRTLLTLDILNKIVDFKDIFDLDLYYKERDKYIIKVLIHQESSPLYREIKDLMKVKNYKVSLKVKIQVFFVKVKHFLLYIPKKIYHFIKKIIPSIYEKAISCMWWW